MDYTAAIGPGSDYLQRNAINGRTLVSRNGEITQNSFIDYHVWNSLVRRSDNRAEPYDPSAPFGPTSGLQGTEIQSEMLPPYFQWASVQPGFITVFKKGSQNYRNKIETETEVPVIACAQLLTENDNDEFVFAGVARSASIRDYDDQQKGMKTDDHFTLAIGGMVTILNNSNNAINRGDLIEWTFLEATAPPTKKDKAGPRRIQVRKCGDNPSRKIGRAMGNARRNEQFDLLIQPY